MKKLFKRLVSVVAAFTVMALNATSSFASDVETNDFDEKNGECIELTVTSEGITSINGERSTNGSIYGYGYECLRRETPHVILAPDGEGRCTIGLTIKMQSTWDGYLSLFFDDGKGNRLISDRAVWSNTENIITGIETDYTPNYVLHFNGIPEGVEVHTWVWIYG